MALLGWFQERWSVREHPRPYVPKNCFYKVHRGDDIAFGEAFYRCSYLVRNEVRAMAAWVLIITRAVGYRRKEAL
jgi:hypothetical protein